MCIRDRDKIISGPEWLYKNILKDKKVIAVSGTHGKTSVTSMIAHALINNGENPSYLIAGIPKGFNKSWNLTESNYFVIEADEYDSAFFDKRSKFIHYKPDILLMQEIKTPDDNFPYAEFEKIGFSSNVFGQKSYNGVAILSKKVLHPKKFKNHSPYR